MRRVQAIRCGAGCLLELLEEEISAGNAFLRARVQRSAGQELTGTTVLRAHRITAARYSIHHAPGLDVNIVEALGDYVCSFYMRPRDASGAANVRRSHIGLDDATVVDSVSTTFDDEIDGLTARLSITLPSNCEALVQQHLEHFAVEFRTWILLAVTEQVTPI